MTHKNSSSQAKYGALISYFSIAFYVISGFLYTPFLISKLGMSDYGIFTMSLSVIAYFTMDFGIGSALTRFIARYLAEDNEKQVKNLVGLTLKLYLVIDFIILLALIIVYCYSDSIFTSLSAEELERFKVVFVITASFVVVSFPLLPLNGIFLAYERIIAVQSIEFFTKIINVCMLVTSLIVGYGLLGVVLVTSVVTISSQAIKLIYLRKKVGLGCNIRYYDKDLLQSIGSFSLWATVASIADKFFFPIIPFILAIVSNTREIALFAIVTSIEGYVLTVARAMNGIFLPKVMKLVVYKSLGEELTDLMIKVGRVQLYIVGLLITVLIIMGKDFIVLWVGHDFSNSYLPMVIVLIPCLFHFTTSIAEELILAKNLVKYRALIYTLGSLVNVSFVFLLSGEFGALGAGIAVSLSYILAYNILAAIIYKKKLGLDVLSFYKRCHLSILPAIICVIVLCFFMFAQITFYHPIIDFVIKTIIVCILVVTLYWTICMNKEEKNIVKSIILKIK